MTARLLILPEFIVALSAFAPSPARSELPEAPAPRVKKTTAELLVGKWSLVKVDKEVIGPQVNITAEFTMDGKFIFEATDPTVARERRTGTYTLNGNIIRLTTQTDTNGPAGKSWDVLIENLSESERITIAGPPNARQRSVFKRIEPK
jgi:hypothetical protein